jgi:predicted HTH transcriptional regulator
MKSLGFVNKFGYGVIRAKDLLRRMAIPRPAFEFDEHSVLVKVFRDPNENGRFFNNKGGVGKLTGLPFGLMFADNGMKRSG